MNLRPFDQQSAEACPWKSPQVAFILIDGRDQGPASYARTVTEKREFLRQSMDEDWLFLVAWPGEWRQDIFLFNEVARRVAEVEFGVEKVT